MKRFIKILPIILILCSFFDVYSQERIRVVNMIPRTLSGETNQDSEPNIAVNPANINEIAASCFRGNPAAGAANAPIFISTDGGSNWSLNNVIPGNNINIGTGDITLKFGSDGSSLYAGMLRGDARLRMMLLRSSDPNSSNPMETLTDRNREQLDQPYVQATTIINNGVTNDRVYWGYNNVGNRQPPATNTGRTAELQFSNNAGAPSPNLLTNVIERRNTSAQNMPAIRTAIHSNGTIYSIFYNWVSGTTPNANCDVVVVRDDNWGQNATPFSSLLDANDNIAGLRVVNNRRVPAFPANLGNNRLVASNLSIAVDPRNSQNVFIAWADRVATNDYTLHVRNSTDGGNDWSNDLITITNATNPALAINSDGIVGFLYQQLITGQWQTHIQRTSDNGVVWNNIILSDTPDGNPVSTSPVYLGDYIDLMCVGQNFYGVFSASNIPNNTNFPQGVTYLRNANFATNQLIDRRGNTVNPSIDPFFFAIEPTNVFINSLSVEITVGDDHHGDTAWPDRNHVSGDIVTIFLSDGTSIPLSLNEGQTWLAHTTHIRTIPLPVGTLLEDIRSIEIRHNAAGPDHAADNWTLQRIVVSATPTSGDNREILNRFGSPWFFQFRKNNNQSLQFNF